jgi:Rod binding domain-containing protein
MLVQQYAESISQAGGVGIADSIVRELLRMQQTVVVEESTDGA